MTVADERPLPTITDENRPFWEAAQSEEFRAQQCPSCRRLRALPQGVCPHCLAEGGEWVPLSGRGTLTSWCVYARPFHPAFASRVPYVIAQVDLDEGIRYIAPLVRCAPERLAIGQRVHVVYERVSDTVTLPLFALDETP